MVAPITKTASSQTSRGDDTAVALRDARASARNGWKPTNVSEADPSSQQLLDDQRRASRSQNPAAGQGRASQPAATSRAPALLNDSIKSPASKSNGPTTAVPQPASAEHANLKKRKAVVPEGPPRGRGRPKKAKLQVDEQYSSSARTAADPDASKDAQSSSGDAQSLSGDAQSLGGETSGDEAPSRSIKGNERPKKTTGIGKPQSDNAQPCEPKPSPNGQPSASKQKPASGQTTHPARRSQRTHAPWRGNQPATAAGEENAASGSEDDPVKMLRESVERRLDQRKSTMTSMNTMISKIGESIEEMNGSAQYFRKINQIYLKLLGTPDNANSEEEARDVLELLLPKLCEWLLYLIDLRESTADPYATLRLRSGLIDLILRIRVDMNKWPSWKQKSSKKTGSGTGEPAEMGDSEGNPEGSSEETDGKLENPVQPSEGNEDSAEGNAGVQGPTQHELLLSEMTRNFFIPVKRLRLSTNEEIAKKTAEEEQIIKELDQQDQERRRIRMVAAEEPSNRWLAEQQEESRKDASWKYLTSYRRYIAGVGSVSSRFQFKERLTIDSSIDANGHQIERVEIFRPRSYPPPESSNSIHWTDWPEHQSHALYKALRRCHRPASPDDMFGRVFLKVMDTCCHPGQVLSKRSFKEIALFAAWLRRELPELDMALTPPQTTPQWILDIPDFFEREIED